MRNCNYNLTNVVLRKVKDEVYYFDEQGVYRRTLINEINETVKMNLFNIFGDIRWDKFTNYSLIFGNLNKRSIDEIIGKLNEGDSIETFYEQLSTVKTTKRISMPQGIERFITKIGKPMFIREPENDRKNSFDFISIEANIVANWEQDRMQYIKENKDKIIDMVISKLEKDRSFKRYGIPINFLKLSKITLRSKCNYIQFVFELKKF